ncbi:MAG TPA: ribosome biogenesis GTP-binding protein YihA/YsxC [Gammaproteobacteria bacterium]|nr:ribosome biogenesis GTP-binding protein YihA/YsxC [Gammaproteobacteria bacterium]
MQFSQARFLLSAAGPRDMPADAGREVAFAGRSNAGKSSALNRLASRRGLARTSATPGRTQLVNFFALDDKDERRLVDLPGYGYARAPQALRNQWMALVERYLGERRSLSGLVLLADSRLPLKPEDEALIDWARASRLPLLLLLTKADKLGRAAQAAALARAYQRLVSGETALVFSAVSGLSVETARDWIANRLEMPQAAQDSGSA